MNNNLVSIVMSTKNRPLLVSRAISSILNQKYKYFEFIIVDASTNDESKRVIEKFNDNRIVYLRIENEINFAKTMNFALSKCQYKYIAFQDDDDESLPDRLEKQITFFESLPEQVGIIYCWEEIFNDKAEVTVRISKPDLRGYIFWELLEKGGGTGGGTQLMIRNSTIKDLGGFIEEIKLNSDYIFYLKLSKKYEFDFQSDVLIRTHINHIYVRSMTFIENNPLGIKNSIEATEYLLNTYSKEFRSYPIKKYYHYENLILCNAKLKNFRKCFKYLFLLLDPKMIRFRTLKTTVKVFKYLIL